MIEKKVVGPNKHRTNGCGLGWLGLIFCAKNSYFWGSKIVFSGAPGRGVLRFFGQGIQEARSFFGKKHVFFGKCADLGVDVI